MPLAIPPELKKINPFIRRAEELDRDTTRPESRLVAYYLRQYAVQEGIPLSTLSESKVCLGHILEALESEQAAMNQFTREEAALICRQFCQKVFETADEQDRMGLASQETAKTFYAASTFMQALAQFESDEDQKAEDKKKTIYSKWKATEILKALKDGPTSKSNGYEHDAPLNEKGGRGGEEEEEEEEKGRVDETDQGLKKLDAPDDPQFGKERELANYDLEKDDNALSSLHTPLENDAAREKVKQGEGDEGTEVDIRLPPTYVDPGPPLSSVVDLDPRLPLGVPPPLYSPLLEPPPVTSAPVVAEDQGIFRTGSKAGGSSQSVTKIQIDDAIELTKFAMAALHDKNCDLAAERLMQALSALGR